MPIEELQAKILELNEALAAMTNERDAAISERDSAKEENETLRKLNQSYFNKLSAQYSEPEKDDEPETPPTCEEFAKTIKL